MSNKAQLIFQGTKFRVVALARYSAGYEDDYVLERQDTDALGDKQWIKVHAWPVKLNGGEGDFCSALVGLLKEALARPNASIIATLQEGK